VQDLHAAARLRHVAEVPVLLEIRFPPDFPWQPPFIRVVAPRFAFHTGHVTVGGSICMELLTSAWSC
jgi:ubiquitin-conjugating enzyme E2 Q